MKTRKLRLLGKDRGDVAFETFLLIAEKARFVMRGILSSACVCCTQDAGDSQGSMHQPAVETIRTLNINSFDMAERGSTPLLEAICYLKALQANLVQDSNILNSSAGLANMSRDKDPEHQEPAEAGPCARAGC